jgi:hypothetical protein
MTLLYRMSRTPGQYRVRDIASYPLPEHGLGPSPPPSCRKGHELWLHWAYTSECFGYLCRVFSPPPILALAHHLVTCRALGAGLWNGAGQRSANGVEPRPQGAAVPRPLRALIPPPTFRSGSGKWSYVAPSARVGKMGNWAGDHEVPRSTRSARTSRRGVLGPSPISAQGPRPQAPEAVFRLNLHRWGKVAGRLLPQYAARAWTPGHHRWAHHQAEGQAWIALPPLPRKGSIVKVG